MLRINGSVRQSCSTDKLIFPVDVLISYISQFISFERGDVIYTGTPEGVSRINSGDVLEAALQDSNGNSLVTLTAFAQNQ
jgi:2-keto-4-pentenoate hydratase/2-oxohepta-3-ene-1,7-dioic acid hydratase in catechol pathway